MIEGKITDPFVRNWLDLLCFLLSGLPANGTIAAEVSAWGVACQYRLQGMPCRMNTQCFSTLIALCWTQPQYKPPPNLASERKYAVPLVARDPCGCLVAYTWLDMSALPEGAPFLLCSCLVAHAWACLHSLKEHPACSAGGLHVC